MAEREDGASGICEFGRREIRLRECVVSGRVAVWDYAEDVAKRER